MSATTLAVDAPEGVYLAAFAAQEPQLKASSPRWLHEIRKAALERFAALGFPTTRLEEWKYTNVAPLAQVPFELADGVPPSRVSGILAAAPLAAPGAAHAVVVNGRYSAALSSANGLAQDVTLCGLAEALLAEPGLAGQHLACYASFEKRPFVALNTAFLEDGVFLQIPDGLVLEQPVHLQFVSVPAGPPSVCHPRTLILAGRESRAQVIEEYVGLDGVPYFTNAVTELVIGEGATLDYAKLEGESAGAFHFGALQVRQGRDSRFTSHSIALGGALVRNELCAVLAGEGAECTLNGLYVVGGVQHIDNYTTMDHAQPNGTSHELYKGVLDEKAQAVFHGRIIVRPHAQKTDAIQRNKNLLLAEDAVINTKPQLEIHADDVRCTHGATVGQVDSDAVFYLQSRGVARAEARRLLTYAFAAEMLERLPAEGLRARVGKALLARLNGG